MSEHRTENQCGDCGGAGVLPPEPNTGWIPNCPACGGTGSVCQPSSKTSNADDYSDFGGLPSAMRAFTAFPMDPRMRRMLLNGADEIERLRTRLRELDNKAVAASSGAVSFPSEGRQSLPNNLPNRASDEPSVEPPTSYTVNTPICPKCGQIDIRIPRMGIYHVCPTVETSDHAGSNPAPVFAEQGKPAVVGGTGELHAPSAPTFWRKCDRCGTMVEHLQPVTATVYYCSNDCAE